jgi:hypothetical protein
MSGTVEKATGQLRTGFKNLKTIPKRVQKKVRNTTRDVSAKILNPVDSFQKSSVGQVYRNSGAPANIRALKKSLAESRKPVVGDRFFSYQPKHYADYTSAQKWVPGANTQKVLLSGTDANKRINADYHQINKDMQRYLKGDPDGSTLPEITDWTSYGKYASREAGEQIRNTEDVLDMMAGKNSATDLLRYGTSLTALEQLARTGLNAGEGLSDGIDDARANHQNATVLRKAIKTASDQPVAKLNSALVKGNTEIHQNIAPAFDAFLKGEAAGGKGLDELKKAGYRKGSVKDPQGFVTKAFSDYQDAREYGLKAQSSKDPGMKLAYQAKRDRLMKEGNLLLGFQEQMEILQKPGVFEDPTVAHALKLVDQTMSVTDPNGVYDFLPKGGTWTNFSNRMGLREVHSGAGGIRVKDTSGQVRYYKPDPRQKGTIYDYFERNANGKRARALNQGTPRPLEQEQYAKD